jgi:hypothetical protein
MIQQEALLVKLVKLVDKIPESEAPQKKGRGRPKVYADRLIIKALVIMVIRRLYTAYSLLAFLEQDTLLTGQLKVLLTDEQGRFPSRRTWERRLKRVPDSLPGGVTLDHGNIGNSDQMRQSSVKKKIDQGIPDG